MIERHGQEIGLLNHQVYRIYILQHVDAEAIVGKGHPFGQSGCTCSIHQNRYVLGSGVEIALLCDIRIASEETVFGLPEVSLGMIPAAGGTQTLPRIIGKGKALQMILAGDRIDAQEALRIGLVNMVVSREELYLSADRMAKKILSHSFIAIRHAKEAVTRGLDLTLKEGLLLERRLAEITKALANSESTYLVKGSAI